MAAWPEAKAGYRYAEGKWSVREVVGHMADTERIMTYRLLRIARGDETPLAGFDENAYQLEERLRVSARWRASWPSCAPCATPRCRWSSSLDAAALDRAGIANNQRTTARALAWMRRGTSSTTPIS